MKSFKTMLALALVIASAFAFSACEGEDQSATIQPPTITSEQELPEVRRELPKKLAIQCETLLRAAENGESVDVPIYATVKPDTALNKEVDFSVSWGEGAERAAENVEEYLTVVQESNGSNEATIRCFKAFGTDSIIITVTTRDGGFQDTCTVTYVGAAHGMEIVNNLITQTTDARGSYYALHAGATYNFDVNLTSVLGEVTQAGSFRVSQIGGVGELYFGTGEITIYGDLSGSGNKVEKKALNDIAGRFFTASVSGNVLTVTVSEKLLESYFATSQQHDYNYFTVTDMLISKAAVEAAMGGRTVSEGMWLREYQQQVAYNAEAISTAYFFIKVTDTVSGVSQQIKVYPKSGVTAVELSKQEITV